MISLPKTAIKLLQAVHAPAPHIATNLLETFKDKNFAQKNTILLPEEKYIRLGDESVDLITIKMFKTKHCELITNKTLQGSKNRKIAQSITFIFGVKMLYVFIYVYFLFLGKTKITL